MSEENATPSGVEDAVRAAYDRLPDISGARARARRVRLALPITAILIILVGLWAIVGVMQTNVFDRKDELIAHGRMKIDSILPRLERQVSESGNRLVPQLRSELSRAQAKAQENLGDVLARHTTGLEERLQQKMNAQLDTALMMVAEQQRSKLKATFPDRLKCQPSDTPEQCAQKEADLNRVMDEIQRSYRDWAIQEMSSTFAEHLEAMNNIRETMNKFGTPGGSDAEGTSSAMTTAPGDMVMLFLELAAEYVGGNSDLFEEPSDGGQ